MLRSTSWPTYNPHVIALNLYSPVTADKQKANLERLNLDQSELANMMEVFSAMKDFFFNHEEIIRQFGYQDTRICNLDVGDTTLFDFDMTAAKKEELLSKGAACFQKYKTQREANAWNTLCAIDLGEITDDFLKWMNEVDRGNADACCELGLKYLRGEGVAASVEKAKHYFTLARELGANRGSYLLGLLYRERAKKELEDSEKRQIYYAKAITYLEEIAPDPLDSNEVIREKSDDPYRLEALFMLGLMKYKGEIGGLPIGCVKGKYQILLKHDSKLLAEAKKMLDPLIGSPTFFWITILPRMKPLKEYPNYYSAMKAFEVCRKFMHPGNARAQAHYYYAKSIKRCDIQGVRAKCAKAMWRASEEGFAKAQYQYGCYLYGGLYGMAENSLRAAVWWEKAAKQGHKEALYKVGMSYYWGLKDVTADWERGIKYLYKASDLGHYRAKQLVTWHRTCWLHKIGLQYPTTI